MALLELYSLLSEDDVTQIPTISQEEINTDQDSAEAKSDSSDQASEQPLSQDHAIRCLLRDHLLRGLSECYVQLGLSNGPTDFQWEVRDTLADDSFHVVR